MFYELASSSIMIDNITAVLTCAGAAVPSVNTEKFINWTSKSVHRFTAFFPSETKTYSNGRNHSVYNTEENLEYQTKTSFYENKALPEYNIIHKTSG